MPIRCNFSLLVTLDVSVCLICPMWFQCRCRLQSRVNYIYFVMLASLFFHFISNQSACACVCMCVWTPLYLYWYYYYHQLQFAAIESPHGSRFTARLCCPHNFINRKEIISTLSCVLSDLCSSYSTIDDPTTPNWWLLPSWQWIKWAYVIIYWYWVSL